MFTNRRWMDNHNVRVNCKRNSFDNWNKLQSRQFSVLHQLSQHRDSSSPRQKLSSVYLTRSFMNALRAGYLTLTAVHTPQSITRLPIVMNTCTAPGYNKISTLEHLTIMECVKDRLHRALWNCIPVDGNPFFYKLLLVPEDFPVEVKNEWFQIWWTNRVFSKTKSPSFCSLLICIIVKICTNSSEVMRTSVVLQQSFQPMNVFKITLNRLNYCRLEYIVRYLSIQGVPHYAWYLKTGTKITLSYAIAFLK